MSPKSIEQVFQPDLAVQNPKTERAIKMADGTVIHYKKSTINLEDYASQTIGLLLYFYGLTGGDIKDIEVPRMKNALQPLFPDYKIYTKNLGRIINGVRQHTVTIQKKGITYWRFHSYEDYCWGCWFYYKSWYNEPIVTQWNMGDPIGPHIKEDLEKVLLDMNPSSIVDFYYDQRLAAKALSASL